jgi:hypothetical protein
MARSRNIKPGLYKNEDLAECSIWARFVFPGLWMLGDKAGRLEDRPKRIKGELLPYDDVEMSPLLDELAIRGFILRYVVDGQGYIQICKFAEHQSPHVREQASTIPAPGEQGQDTSKVVPDTAKVLPEPCLGDAEPLPRSPDSLIPDSLIPDSPITTSPSADDVRQCPAGTLVDLYHELMPINPRVKVLNAARKSAIRARWLEAAKLDCWPFGYTTKSAGLEAWRQFFGVCAESKFLTGLSPPMAGKPAFIADVDFLFSASGFAKTLESKYHRDAP